MPRQQASLTELVSIFLPLDPDQIDAAFESDDEISVLAASLGSFSVAAILVLGRLGRYERHELCRQIYALSDNEIQPWMVEAAFRSVEGNHDALTGTDPQLMSGIHLYSLSLFGTEYLTVQECVALRSEAHLRAEEYRLYLASP